MVSRSESRAWNTRLICSLPISSGGCAFAGVNYLHAALPAGVQQAIKNIALVRPGGTVMQCRSDVSLDVSERVRGKRVLVIEDGPTLRMGNRLWRRLDHVARRYGAAEIVDPRIAAKGSLAGLFKQFPSLAGAARHGLATAVDLGRLIPILKPHCRTRYELKKSASPI